MKGPNNILAMICIAALGVLIAACGENKTYYQIENKKSGYYISTDGSTESGSGLKQQSAPSGDNGLWELIDAGDGFYQILSKQSQLFISGIAGQTQPLEQTDELGDNALWQKLELDDGYIQLKSKGTGQSINTAGSKAENAAIKSAAANLGSGSHWKLIEQE